MFVYIYSACEHKFFDDDAFSRICPRCRHILEEKQFGEILIDIYINCQGIWLDDGEILAIVQQYRKGERGEKVISDELATGLVEKYERPTLQESVKSLFSFLGKYLSSPT